MIIKNNISIDEPIDYIDTFDYYATFDDIDSDESGIDYNLSFKTLGLHKNLQISPYVIVKNIKDSKIIVTIDLINHDKIVGNIDDKSYDKIVLFINKNFKILIEHFYGKYGITLMDNVICV